MRSKAEREAGLVTSKHAGARAARPATLIIRQQLIYHGTRQRIIAEQLPLCCPHYKEVVIKQLCFFLSPTTPFTVGGEGW